MDGLGHGRVGHGGHNRRPRGKKIKGEITVTHIIMLCVVLGQAYNALMDFSSWITFYRSDPNPFVPSFVAGIPLAYCTSSAMWCSPRCWGNQF